MSKAPKMEADLLDGWGRIADTINQALPGMHPTNRKIALYVLEDAHRVGFSSIQSLGKAIGVSEATIVRFAKSIGFNGYSEFRKAIQKAIKQQLNPYNEIESDGLNQLDNDKKLGKIFRYELENLKNTFRNITTKNINNIIEDLKKADKIYVCGFGSTKYIAELYGFLLIANPGKAVITVTGSIADYIQKLSLFSERDMLIMVSVPIYAKEDSLIAGFVKKRGGKICLFTDSPRCPAYALADYSVLCANKSFYYTNSYLGLIAGFKVLMDMWLVNDRAAFVKRMKSVTDLEIQSYEDIGSVKNLPFSKP